MRRIIMLVVVALILAAMLLASALPALAAATPPIRVCSTGAHGPAAGGQPPSGSLYEAMLATLG